MPGYNWAVTAAPAFKDHFSLQSEAYRRFRPEYPATLFEWLAARAPGRGLAIDVATGNGQAARALAGHFDRVIATEPSAAQLAQAIAHPRVDYRREAAEAISAADGSADLLVAAQAAHWFDWPRFVRAIERQQVDLRRGSRVERVRAHEIAGKGEDGAVRREWWVRACVLVKERQNECLLAAR